MSTESRSTSRGRVYFVPLVLVATALVASLVFLQLGGAAAGDGLGAGESADIAAATSAAPDRGSRSADSNGVGSSPAPADAAEQALRGFLRASDHAYQEADGEAGGVARYATEGMVAEVEAASLDLQAQDIKHTGQVRVEYVTVLETSKTEITLAACLNVSRAAIVDRSGFDMRAAQDLETRSLHHYTVTLVDTTWRVSSLSFPDDASC